MVAAEVPLRGKIRAEVTLFSIDQRILEVFYRCLQTPFVQGLILCWRPRIAPCSTRGTSDTCRPRVFCWVLTSDLESGGARCARRPTHARGLTQKSYFSALCAVRLPLVELGLIVRISPGLSVAAFCLLLNCSDTDGAAPLHFQEHTPHDTLCPIFQCAIWYSLLQYDTTLHRPQTWRLRALTPHCVQHAALESSRTN